jgi:hypothetical protein
MTAIAAGADRFMRVIEAIKRSERDLEVVAAS